MLAAAILASAAQGMSKLRWLGGSCNRRLLACMRSLAMACSIEACCTDHAGQGRAGQGRAEQSRAGQSYAQQSQAQKGMAV